MNSARHVLIAAAIVFSAGRIATPETQVYFTQEVDRRFAWLGNDAHENTDFVGHVVDLINAATTSIDASTMSFSSTAIGSALAERAKAGVTVRIVMNGKHRFQPGIMQALKGPCQVIDDNFPALVARVNFQQSGGVSPSGWLIDTGQVFGPRTGGFSYGWTQSATSDMKATPDASYASSLLGHCYARPNSEGTNTWEIAVPNGFYYVHLVVGQPTFNPENVILVEGLPVLQAGSGFAESFETKGDKPGLDPDGTGPLPPPPPGVDAEEDDFRSATVTGGGEAQRIQVSDGRLSIAVGRNAPGIGSFSSLAYVEIYKGDSDSEGDEWDHADRVQKFGLVHSKFLILDGTKAWISSANLTGGASGRSEDAIETTDPGVVAALKEEFDQQWGGGGAVPAEATARFQRFKTAAGPTTISVPGVLLPGSFPWRIMFSPSRTSPSLDLAEEVKSLLDSSDHELIINLEQFTDANARYGFNTSRYLLDRLDSRINTGLQVWGIFGNEMGTDRIFTIDDGHPHAFIGHQSSEEDGIGLHDKFMLVDALKDTRYTKRGRLLMGSMNWSQAGIVSNDEISIRIDDPAIANQYLQRAMKALADEGLSYDRRADIVLILDRSYSMNAESASAGISLMDASKLAVDAFLSILEPGVGHRVALIRFGSDVEPFAPESELVPFVSDTKAALMPSITGTTATGPLSNSTCYGRALQRAHDQLENGSSSARPRSVVHLFTDGLENTAPMADGEYQRLIEDFGAEIHSTGFGPFSPYAPGGTASILGTMAEASGGSFVQVAVLSPMDLQKRFIEVARDAVGLDAVLDPVFHVSPKKPVQVEVSIDSTAERAQFVAYWGSKRPDLVSLKIKTPWGLELTSASPGVQVVTGDGSVVWQVHMRKLGSALSVGTAGPYIVNLTTEERDANGRPVGLAVFADSRVDLQGDVAAQKPGSGAIQLLARLLVDGKPWPETHIRGEWIPSKFGGEAAGNREITLYDDGVHGDGHENDGLFGVQFDAAPGPHEFLIIAEAKVPKKRLGVPHVRREMTLQHMVHLNEPHKGPPPRELDPDSINRR